MAEHDTVGLDRSDLQYEVKWLMRKMPSDPARAMDFLTDVIVTMIDKNNAAIARHLAERDGDDTEGF